RSCLYEGFEDEHSASMPRLYICCKEIIMQKGKIKPATISFIKYLDINKALEKARKYLGEDFYIEPLAKTYIQNYKCKKTTKLIYPKFTTLQPIKAERYLRSLRISNFCRKIDKEYLEWKMIELLQHLDP
ncbi:hypothetical protein U9M48_035090, partial [Paspalum notatum var. saurae]